MEEGKDYLLRPCKGEKKCPYCGQQLFFLKTMTSHDHFESTLYHCKNCGNPVLTTRNKDPRLTEDEFKKVLEYVIKKVHKEMILDE